MWQTIEKKKECCIVDTLTKEQRKKCMSPIHSKDTGIEMPLREVLWRKGYR